MAMEGGGQYEKAEANEKQVISAKAIMLQRGSPPQNKPERCHAEACVHSHQREEE